MAHSDLDSPSHEIVIVQTPEERQQCYDVRIEVFHREQKFPLETEIDDMEDSGTHFLLRLTPSMEPIGTIRAHKMPGGYYKLSRLVVLKGYRRYGFGRELVLALHQWAKAHALEGGDIEPIKVVCHSQIPAKSFYTKFGYEPEGAEFDEDGDPHQKMVLHLPLDPSH